MPPKIVYEDGQVGSHYFCSKLTAGGSEITCFHVHVRRYEPRLICEERGEQVKLIMLGLDCGSMKWFLRVQFFCFCS